MAPKRSSSSSNAYMHKRRRTSGSFKKFSKPSVTAMVQREILKTAELKEIYTVAIATASNQTGTLVPLNNAIAQGDTISARTGNRITTREIDILYGYVGGAGNSSGLSQVALVYDAQPNAATPVYSDVFATTTTNAGMALKNTANNNDRFKIFWIDFLPDICVSEDGYQLHRRHYLRLNLEKHKKYMDVRYNTTAAAQPVTGAWYLAYGDTQSNAGTATITYRCKYRFTDA